MSPSSFYLTVWLCLVESPRISKKHVYNSLVPEDDLIPVYNVTAWVKQLNLQQCVFVELGDKYCAVFVESHSIDFKTAETKIEEYFLGVCDTATLRLWNLCSDGLKKKRPKDCIFNENIETSRHPARVHRRICDVSSIAFYGDHCNCDGSFAEQKLYKVIGFPTCFYSPLPKSICSVRNVCGVHSCNESTVSNTIHTVTCNPKCFGQQPFCEPKNVDSSRIAKVHSYWTDWTEPVSYKNEFSEEEGNTLVYTEAMCLNTKTGMGDIDCFGPGTNCCTKSMVQCRCHVYLEDGVLKLFRQYRAKEVVNSDERSYSYLARDRRKLFRHHRNSGYTFPRKQPDKQDIDYEDDDENPNDENEEDVVLEEDEGIKERIRYSTTDKAERKENLQMQHQAGNKSVYLIESNTSVNTSGKFKHDRDQENSSSLCVLYTVSLLFSLLATNVN